MEEIRLFFEKCFSANQAQIIHFRKTRGSMLDLEAHINQYVRSYNPPIVPHIKLEPLVDFDGEEDDGPEFPEPDDDDDDEDYDQGGVHHYSKDHKKNLCNTCSENEEQRHLKYTRSPVSQLSFI